MANKNRTRWPELPGCAHDVDDEDCLRGYRLILLVLATLVLAAWFR